MSQDSGGTPRRIVRLPITSVAKPSTISKRQIHEAIQDDAAESKFVITIGIGTPPQNVSVAFDTGSDDLWVLGACLSSTSATSCPASPQYSPEKSTTAKDQRRGDRIQYGAGGVNVTGEYYSDNINFEGAQIQGQQFLVANMTTNFTAGLMGVGPGASFFNNITFTDNVTVHGRAPNIIDQMAAQSIINSRAFGLTLGNGTKGSIIFDGIDTKKYSGPLDKFPMIPWKDSPDKIPRYWLNMSSMVVNKWGESKAAVFNEPLTVFLDSGAEYSYLPQHIIQPLIDATGATKYTKSAYSIECTSESIDGSPKFSGSVDFGFGNLTIRVPVQQLTNIDDYVEDSCILGVKQTNDPYDIPYVLGENFLRSAFANTSQVVFDQDNQNIHLAQGANCGTNLVSIGKGLDAVPSVVRDCVAPTEASVAATAMVASTAKPAFTAASKLTKTSRPKTTSKAVVPVRPTRATKATSKKRPGATGAADGYN